MSVSKKLHLICGACGDSEQLSFKIEQEGHDIDGNLVPAVFITCHNCGELSSLDDHIEEME